MNNYWYSYEDAASSAAVLNTIKPVLEDYFGGELLSTENSEDIIAKTLDRKCGVDAIIVTSDETVFGIASRVHYKRYNAFAIRTVRKAYDYPTSVNVKTELDHITRSGFKPRYHVSTCAVADGYYIAIAKTVDIVDYINNNNCKSYANPKNGSECKFVPYAAVNAVELFILKNTEYDDF